MCICSLTLVLYLLTCLFFKTILLWLIIRGHAGLCIILQWFSTSSQNIPIVVNQHKNTQCSQQVWETESCPPMYMIAYMTNLRMPVTEYCFSYNLELYKIAFYLLVFIIRVYYNGVFKKVFEKEYYNLQKNLFCRAHNVPLVANLFFK